MHYFVEVTVDAIEPGHCLCVCINITSRQSQNNIILIFPQRYSAKEFLPRYPLRYIFLILQITRQCLSLQPA